MIPTAVFLFNLVQDVNILRPLVVMASRDFGFSTLFFISDKFAGRDPYHIWSSEVEELAAATGARTILFHNAWEAARELSGHGILFAASESHLPNHAGTHDIMRIVPSSYQRVTLQHGFECVGFHHSADHVRAHGETASFGADLICSWGATSLASLASSQQAKLVVTGPTFMLQTPAEPLVANNDTGIVCENLHSVRFKGSGDRVAEFVETFADFCSLMANEEKSVTLRPHPGGQYVLKNKVALPANAIIENSPMYRVDLRQFAYGISAPSSVLADMVLAGIPTAVWRDRQGVIDSDHYSGLASVSTAAEWVAFAAAARSDPQPFLERQAKFIEESGIVSDREQVYANFAALFDAVARREARPVASLVQRHRLQFIANAHVPTLQLSFDKPLAGPVAAGAVFTDLLTEQELVATGLLEDDRRLVAWIDERLNATAPTTLIFCRYSGPAWKPMLEWARRNRVPVVYHIDDDLMAVPTNIGARKHALHNSPERLGTVRSVLAAADLVYASTDRLRDKLIEYLPDLNITTGTIYCSGSIIRRPSISDRITIGYMASADHAHNLTMVLPAIERLLDRHDDVVFELFGSIPIPRELVRFGDRVTTAPPVTDYTQFLNDFAARGWDIGICPLAPIEFNLMKANTKWVEYSAAGAAVVASRGTVYDSVCSDGCGLLADGVEEWFDALDQLVRNPAQRFAQIESAQARLRRDFSLERLREQVFAVIERATVRAAVATR
jgi:glycosyltransferase involved in cell wall biosynthesis